MADGTTITMSSDASGTITTTMKAPDGTVTKTMEALGGTATKTTEYANGAFGAVALSSAWWRYQRHRRVPDNQVGHSSW